MDKKTIKQTILIFPRVASIIIILTKLAKSTTQLLTSLLSQALDFKRSPALLLFLFIYLYHGKSFRCLCCLNTHDNMFKARGHRAVGAGVPQGHYDIVGVRRVVSDPGQIRRSTSKISVYQKICIIRKVPVRWQGASGAAGIKVSCRIDWSKPCL